MSRYAFRSGEALDAAFRQILRHQLRSAGRALAVETTPALAVHRARRCLKRARALLSLLSPAYGKRRWAKPAKALKAIADRLSGARDEQARLDALARLAAGGRRPLPTSSLEVLRKVIETRRLELERAAEAALEDDLTSRLERVARKLGKTRLKRFGEPALIDGIVRTYRRGRRAMRHAYASGEDLDFHAWRREVQTHWRHMQLIAPRAPAEAIARAEAAKTLAGLLGEDHDLWLLLADLADPALPLGQAARQRLRRAIVAAQTALREQAKAIGDQLYAEKPKALRRWLLAAWDTPVAKSAVPVKRKSPATRRAKASSLVAA
ncbi:MAG: CHAD domain-containing protein [Hyphomicrobiaceae bacterium]